MFVLLFVETVKENYMKMMAWKLPVLVSAAYEWGNESTGGLFKDRIVRVGMDFNNNLLGRDCSTEIRC